MEIMTEEIINSMTQTEVPANEHLETILPLEIAGFWRRLLASLLDRVILGAVVGIFALVFYNVIYSFGPWGRLVGFMTLLVYWTISHSAIGKGQTLGKRILKIRVVNQDGSFLSLGQSFLRALVLVIVFLLNRWAIPFAQNLVFVFISNLLIYGIGLSIFYGLIFNQKTRQGLHDLLVGSYVVKVSKDVQAAAPATPVFHKRFSYGLIGVGLLVAVISVSGMNPANQILEEQDWQEMTDLYEVLSKDDDFFTVSVRRNNQMDLVSKTTSKQLKIAVWTKESALSHGDYRDIWYSLAVTAFEHYEGIYELDILEVTVTNRIDLGLVKFYINRSETRTITEWSNHLIIYE